MEEQTCAMEPPLDKTPDLQAAGAAISPGRLREIVEYLASDDLEGRAPGTEGSRSARAYIESAFRRVRLRPAGEEGYCQKIRTGRGTNIVGLLEGSDPSLKEEVVIVSAHYDHLGRSGDEIYNGADDNASGVAITLEVAAAAAPLMPYLKRSLLFIAFDAEEPPAFLTHAMGSQYFVDHPTVPLDRIALSIGMDLVGTDPWRGWAGRLFVMGEEKCPAAARVLDSVPAVEDLLIRRLGIHMIEQLPVYGRQPFSDYAPFRDREIPYLFLTCGRPEDYHRPTDTPEKLNYEKMARISRFLLSAAVLASRLDEKFRFDRNGQNYLKGAEVIWEGLEFVLSVENPGEVFPGYSKLIWKGLQWGRPRFEKILAKLRAHEQISPGEVGTLEKVSLGLQTLSTNIIGTVTTL